MLEKFPEILTLKQCQQILQVSRSTMLAIIASGDVEAFKVRSNWRVAKSQLIAYIKESNNDLG